MVTDGATTRLVPMTVPIIGLSDKLVAPDTFQDRVLVVPCPDNRDDGFAVKLLIEGGGTTVTVTVALEGENRGAPAENTTV